jgi:hypothetical protein
MYMIEDIHSIFQIESYFGPDDEDDDEDREMADEILDSSCLRDLRSFTTSVDRTNRKAAQRDSDGDDDDGFDDDDDDDVEDADYVPEARADRGRGQHPQHHRQPARVGGPRDEHSEATTTPLVRKVFEIAFRNCIKAVGNNGESVTDRCGSCEACMRPDCGKCGDCKSMTKFGGSGNKHAVSTRRCTKL